MTNMNDAMKQLQMATEKLGHMNFNQGSPWHPLHQMQQVFDQSFWQNIHRLTNMANQSMENQGAEPAGQSVQAEPVRATAKETQTDYSPRIDIFETLGKIIVCCDVAGMDRNSMKIYVGNGNMLNVKGRIKGHDLSEYLVQKERYQGRFHRAIPLPHAVLTEGVRTTYKDGLLEIHLMKKQ